MERTKKAADGEKIRWVKQGGGSFRMANGRIIKPGQKFEAHPSEIPTGVRDIIIPLDELPPEPEEKLESIPSGYKIQQRGDTTWYDVLDGQGKILNEKALRRTKALELIKELE